MLLVHLVFGRVLGRVGGREFIPIQDLQVLHYRRGQAFPVVGALQPVSLKLSAWIVGLGVSPSCSGIHGVEMVE